jgi:glycosyltransferase involved in cell wall biosynthesis
MVKRIYRKLRPFFADVFRTSQSGKKWLEVYPKTLALCVCEKTDCNFDISPFGGMCEILVFNTETKQWFAHKEELTMENIKTRYEYIWFLSNDQYIRKEIILNLLLMFSKRHVDFVLLSWLSKDIPTVAVLPEAYDNLILSSSAVCGFRKASFENAYGGISRLFFSSSDIFSIIPIEEFFASKLGLKNSLFYNHHEISFDNAVPYDMPFRKFNMPCPNHEDKPTILVLPAFLMVGGVEKNTQGIMNQLQYKYNFIMVVTDGIWEKNGSMHDQMRSCVTALYDFSEIFDYPKYLDALRDIRDTYKPDAVWICNGSTWICDNAANIRKIFYDIPIIDQEVYDTKAGWITRYREKGIQSFDRFIAINQRIYKKFTDDIKMSSEKIDLVYPVVNANILSNAGEYDALLMKTKYSVPTDKKVFAFIGRLSPQKRPLLLLKLLYEIQKTDTSNVFMIIGNGELKEDVLGFAKKLDLSNVFFVDFVYNMNEIYCFLDGIIFVSEYEGLPIVLLEALINGVPALSTDVGDVRLVLDEYNAGYIFDNGLTEDPKSMANDFFIFQENLSQFKKSLSMRKHEVKERFSVQTIAKQWDSLFQRAISDKKGQANG